MVEPLSRLQVIELSEDLPAAYCAKQFAAWGAEVVTAEPPGGSPLRQTHATVEDIAGAPVPLVWEYIGAGKQSVIFDVGDEESARNLKELLTEADVFVTDWPLERLEQAGLGFVDLSNTVPGLVVVSLTPFGTEGPYAHLQATDLIIQALSGFLSLNGEVDGPPLKAPANIVPYACGLSAFIGAMAALRWRDATGAGQLVELSLLEAVASLIPFLRAQYSGIPLGRQGGPSSGTHMFACQGGYVSFNPYADLAWGDLLIALDIDESSVPPELADPLGRQDRPHVRSFIAEHTKGHSAPDLFHRLNELRITCGLLLSPYELLRDEHLKKRAFFREVEHPRFGRVRFPGPAARLGATPMATPKPAPDLGSFRRKEGASLSKRPQGVGLEGQLPLHGLRVVDLTHAWIGPYATMLLADMGAEVIKVEAHHRPDVWRGAETRPAQAPMNPLAHPWNTSPNFNGVNRNKRSLTLNLASERGKELFLRLAARADVVLENFTPRVMENFGLAYEELRRVNPSLVFVSFSGFGKSGPYRNYRGNGAATETLSGWGALGGYLDGPPQMMGTMQADPMSGLQMAALSLVALAHRDRTGEGQALDGAMLETAIGYIGEEILLAEIVGETTLRRANRHWSMAPHGVFPCTGEDEWVAVAVRSDDEWEAFLSVVEGGSGLHNLRFQTAEGRLAHVEELEKEIAQWTVERTARDVMALLQRVGVPAGAVQNTDQVFADPHLSARQWFKPMRHSDMGTHKYNGFPWRFSKAQLEALLPPPRVGEHSAELLAKELLLPDGEIAGLFEQGVTGTVFQAPAEEAPPV